MQSIIQKSLKVYEKPNLFIKFHEDIYSNINEFIEKHYSYNNLFFKAIPTYFTVNTWIFKVSKDFYKKIFYDSKININPNWGWIKKLYYELLINNKSKVWKLKVLPIRSNLSWDNDIWSYNSSITKREPIWIDYLCRFLWIYNIHRYDELEYKFYKKLF